jgi:hypothetical protein
MSKLFLNSKAKFNPNPFWSNPIPEDYIDYDLIESNKAVELFDQNGYDLSPIEIEYAKYNMELIRASESELETPTLIMHRNINHLSIQVPWIKELKVYQTPTPTNYVRVSETNLASQTPMNKIHLNHSMLLERKGYNGEALQQLKTFARRNPLLYKVINIKPKWGLDFSLDYVGIDESAPELMSLDDAEITAFEIFHHEYDSFDYNEIINVKQKLEEKILSVNFEAAAIDLAKRKSEWFNLEFFEQSAWKCRYFGVPNERFKMVVW